MTKYVSGSIAISQLRAGIDDKNHISKNIIQINIFPIQGVLSNCPLVITVICILTGMFALFGIL